MRRETTEKADTEKTGLERRSLLKGFGLGAAGAAAVALSAGTGAAPAEAAESRQEQIKARYQDNAHVERFYALNRL
jgi:formate dehydrogenase region TAT target